MHLASLSAAFHDRQTARGSVTPSTRLTNFPVPRKQLLRIDDAWLPALRVSDLRQLLCFNSQKPINAESRLYMKLIAMVAE